MSTVVRRLARRLPGLRGVAATLDRTRAERNRLQLERDELADRLRAELQGRESAKKEGKKLTRPDLDRPARPSSKAAKKFESVQARLLSTARKQATEFGSRVASELWSHGFLPNKSRLYEIDRYGPKAYLSDLQREMAALINGPYNHVLSNKAVFAQMFSEVVPTVPILGYTNGHEFSGRLPDDATLYARPVIGGGGGGVFRATVENGRVIVRDQALSRAAFVDELLSRSEHYIVSPAVESHPEMRRIFDGTTNTLRILMMRSPTTREAFIPRAVLRVGTVASGDIDNFTNGGLSFAVEVGSGEIGTGWLKGELLAADGVRDPEGEVVGASFVHPDTGAQISGRRVPLWDEVVETCYLAFAHCRVLQYVGWDIIVTPSGPVLLEGNHYSDPLQVHGPLLSDERVRAFYEEHGVLDWQPTQEL
jgi:hypothetical protein